MDGDASEDWVSPRGSATAPATIPPEPDGDPFADILSVETRTNLVHRGLCDRLPDFYTPMASWNPALAGYTDRACPACLPDGLPT